MSVRHIIVVVSYNDIDTTKEFINNAKSLNSADKVVIVDNCSTNNLYETITEYILKVGVEDKFECIRSKKNGGYSYGNNYGIRYAMSNYNPKVISISNADVILNDDALEACIKQLSEHSEFGFVAPIMRTPQRDTVRSYWALPTYNMLLRRNFILLLRVIRKLEKHTFLQKDNLIYADCLNGSFFMGRTETFSQINYLDEDVFLYEEESILGQKIKKAGLQNVIVSDTSYIHNHKGSIELNINSKRKRFEILHESNVIYLTKYLNVSKFDLKFFDFTYHIGLESYLLYIKLKSILSE